MLRKISYGSRQCIDLIKPDHKLLKIGIHVQSIGCALLEMFTESTNRKVSYKASRLSRKSSELDYGNFSNDLFLILKNQKSALEELKMNFMQVDETSESSFKDVTEEEKKYMDEIEGNPQETESHSIWDQNENRFLKSFKDLHASLGRLLPVEKLVVTTRNQKTIVQLLQSVDPSKLNKIEFGTSFDVPASDVWSIEEFLVMEQWRNAKELTIIKRVIKCDVENLVHFRKVDIILDSLSLKNVIYLRDVSSNISCNF